MQFDFQSLFGHHVYSLAEAPHWARNPSPPAFGLIGKPKKTTSLCEWSVKRGYSDREVERKARSQRIMNFQRCLDSNPEICRSKQARYQLSHPSLARQKIPKISLRLSQAFSASREFIQNHCLWRCIVSSEVSDCYLAKPYGSLRSVGLVYVVFFVRHVFEESSSTFWLDIFSYYTPIYQVTHIPLCTRSNLASFERVVRSARNISQPQICRPCF